MTKRCSAARGEQIVAPFAPFRAVRGKRWRRHKGGEGDGGDADEFHGGSRKRWRLTSYARSKSGLSFSRCHRIVRSGRFLAVAGRIHQQPVQRRSAGACDGGHMKPAK